MAKMIVVNNRKIRGTGQPITSVVAAYCTTIDQVENQIFVRFVSASGKPLRASFPCYTPLVFILPHLSSALLVPQVFHSLWPPQFLSH